MVGVTGGLESYVVVAEAALKAALALVVDAPASKRLPDFHAVKFISTKQTKGMYW
jgi:hypothetical protein